MTKEINFRPQDLHISKWSEAAGFTLTVSTKGIHVIHLPTGKRANCDIYRSEHKNKEKALKALQQMMVSYHGITQSTLWRHRNGNEYQVIGFANLGTTNPSKYPETVIYRNTSNGSTWTRSVFDWHRSMTEAEDDE